MITTNNNNTADPRNKQPFTWAAIGTNFETPTSLADAIEISKIGYSVAECPLLATPPELYDGVESGQSLSFAPTKESLVKTHKAIFRTDTHQILGIVGKDYGMVQNTEAFAFIDLFQNFAKCEIIIKCAGETEKGKSFVICQFGEPLTLDKGDVVYIYIVITNSHDGTTPLRVQFCPMRLVCSNGLKIAINGAKSELLFKHTKYVQNRIDLQQAENKRRAIETITASQKYRMFFNEKMLEYKTSTLSVAQINGLTQEMFLTQEQIGLVRQNNGIIENVGEIPTRTKNLIADFENALHYGIGQDVYSGTKLWFLNGITTFLQNGKRYKSESAKFESLQFGTGAQKVQSVYNMLEAV